MSYVPDKKEVRRVYSQGASGEPINEWADEFDQWYFAEIEAAEKRGAVKALRGYADAMAAIPDYASSHYDQGRVDQRHLAITEMLYRADALEENS